MVETKSRSPRLAAAAARHFHFTDRLPMTATTILRTMLAVLTLSRTVAYSPTPQILVPCIARRRIAHGARYMTTKDGERKSVTGTVYSADDDNAPVVTLFTKDGCTLCDKVKDVSLKIRNSIVFVDSMLLECSLLRCGSRFLPRCKRSFLILSRLSTLLIMNTECGFLNTNTISPFSTLETSTGLSIDWRKTRHERDCSKLFKGTLWREMANLMQVKWNDDELNERNRRSRMDFYVKWKTIACIVTPDSLQIYSSSSSSSSPSTSSPSSRSATSSSSSASSSSS